MNPPLSSDGREFLAFVRHHRLDPEVKPVNVYASEGRTPEYLAVNPSGEAPRNGGIHASASPTIVSPSMVILWGTAVRVARTTASLSSGSYANIQTPPLSGITTTTFPANSDRMIPRIVLYVPTAAHRTPDVPPGRARSSGARGRVQARLPSPSEGTP